jgi:hypothetical protein
MQFNAYFDLVAVVMATAAMANPIEPKPVDPLPPHKPKPVHPEPIGPEPDPPLGPVEPQPGPPQRRSWYELPKRAKMVETGPVQYCAPICVSGPHAGYECSDGCEGHKCVDSCD